MRIWSIETSEIRAMQTEKANNRYLPGIPLPNSIHPCEDLATTIKNIRDILIVVPSAGFKQTLISLKPLLSPSQRIICASKGLEDKTGQLLSEMVEEVLGNIPFAVLSGPSFAKEVAQGLSCAVNIASKDAQFLKELQEKFQSDVFFVYPSSDVTGVEIGGVIKNVIAIATGMADGLEAGANVRSAIITFGLAEIISLGVALGAKRETLLGLAGVGDLILTCSDNQSRNRRLGLALGKGKSIEAAEKEIGQVVEGKRNAELAVILAKKLNISMPICLTVWEILQGKLDAKSGLKKFFNPS